MEIEADIISLTPHDGDGEALLTYCIDLETDLITDHPYAEGEWTESNVPNLESVRWVLSNSYPNVSADALLSASDFDGDLDAGAGVGAEVVAYVATQAAVWHYTDGFTLNSGDATVEVDGVADEAIEAVYDYLVDNTGTLPNPDEYNIEIGNLDTATYDGEKFGPYIMQSNVGQVELAAEGGSLVDEDGEAVDVLAGGEEFYISLERASNTITIDGVASYDLPLGRVFLATTPEAVASDFSQASDKEASQKLILAQPRESELPANWAFELEVPRTDGVPESETLPVTGNAFIYAGGLAAVLVAAGTVALLVTTRRRTTTSV